MSSKITEWPPDPTPHGGTTHAIVIGPRRRAACGSSAIGFSGYARRTKSQTQSVVTWTLLFDARNGLGGTSTGVKVLRPSSERRPRAQAGSRSAREPSAAPVSLAAWWRREYESARRLSDPF